MLQKNFVPAKLLVPLMEDMYALPVSVMFIHAICGELCKDTGPFYHTTCFPCFARHKPTFESPDNFQHHVSAIAAADRQEVSAHCMTVDTQQVMDGDAEDNFDDGHKAWDSVHSRTDKANKRRECIKKLTLSQCVVEHVPDGANTLIALCLDCGYFLSKLLLSELQLFWATQKISGSNRRKNRKGPNSSLRG